MAPPRPQSVIEVLPLNASGDPTTPGTPPDSLMQAVRRLLRPLVRLLIAHGVTFPALSALLKELYVSVAEAEFPVPDKKQTDSRIHVLTGVHRKDVRRLRAQTNAAAGPPATVSLGAGLVALWAGAERFVDISGKPRPLPRHRRAAGAPSFDDLVESLSRDVRPRAVLDEWLRLGIVSIDDDDMVWLNTQAFVPEKGFDEKAYYLGRNICDHLAAGAHNLLGEGPPFLDRSVYYDRLSPASVQKLADLSRTLGMEALLEINRQALKLAEDDEDYDGATMRMNFGVYYYSALDDDDDKQEEDS